MPKARYKRIDIQIAGREMPLYAGARVRAAFQEVAMDMDLYKGVRLEQVLEAVYQQGMKDGRREIIEQMDAIKHEANYLPPGRPKKKRRS